MDAQVSSARVSLAVTASMPFPSTAGINACTSHHRVAKPMPASRDDDWRRAFHHR
jgi:hypothetical protein